jgi:hypothetical protein
MFEKAKASPWFITQEDQAKYMKIFEGCDKDKVGFLPD